MKLKTNDTSTTISQLILGGKLLIFVIDGQKNNFNDRLKLEPVVTTYYQRFVVKMLLTYHYSKLKVIFFSFYEVMTCHF